MPWCVTSRLPAARAIGRKLRAADLLGRRAARHEREHRRHRDAREAVEDSARLEVHRRERRQRRVDGVTEPARELEPEPGRSGLRQALAARRDDDTGRRPRAAVRGRDGPRSRPRGRDAGDGRGRDELDASLRDRVEQRLQDVLGAVSLWKELPERLGVQRHSARGEPGRDAPRRERREHPAHDVRRVALEVGVGDALVRDVAAAASRNQDLEADLRGRVEEDDARAVAGRRARIPLASQRPPRGERGHEPRRAGADDDDARVLRHGRSVCGLRGHCFLPT